MNEQQRIHEHFERGRALGDSLIATFDDPGQVYALALESMDKAELPMVQHDPGQVALFAGIVPACAEWIINSAKQTGSLPEPGGALVCLTFETNPN